MKRYLSPARVKRITGRPFVYLNAAMTVDGKLAPASRHFVPFSSRRDGDLLMLLRTEADAVMVGARTVNLTEVDLGPGNARLRKMRLAKGLAEYNLRVVVSGGGDLNPDAHLFQQRFSRIIVLVTNRTPIRRVRELKRVADAVEMFGDDQLDFDAALKWLRREWNVRTLLCEGGGEVNAGLFAAGVVDSLFVTVSPLIFCGRNAPTLADGDGFQEIGDATRLKLMSLQRHKHELFLVYDVVR